MSDAVRGALYSVDTNVFMDWQARYYPTDIFTSLPGKLTALIGEGRLLAAELVKEELDAIGTADVIAWSNAMTAMWVPTDALLAAAYVIALAQLRDGIVVTQETSAAEKRNPKRTHFIPDVCRELGLPCISLLGLMRREGWKL